MEPKADCEARVSTYTCKSSDRQLEPGEARGADNIEYIEYKEVNEFEPRNRTNIE